jgi:hypothetical protein
MHKHDPAHGIDYYNCGAWIDAHPTYITVGEDGVHIHEFHHLSDEERTDSEAAELTEDSEFTGQEPEERHQEHESEYDRVHH